MEHLNLQRVLNIKDYKDSIKEVIRKIREAAQPLLSDRSEMKEIYRLYKAHLEEKNLGWDTERRKHFLFIVIYIYCPNVLVGDPMPKGFRTDLKNLLNVRSQSIISNHTRDLLFLYRQYEDFRTSVDEAYDYISQHMEISNVTVSLSAV